MPQGLQIWDANNNLILDTDNRVVKILGAHVGAMSITVNHPLLLAGSGMTPFYIVTPMMGWNANPLSVTFHDGYYVLKNTYPASDIRTVYIGVY